MNTLDLFDRVSGVAILAGYMATAAGCVVLVRLGCGL